MSKAKVIVILFCVILFGFIYNLTVSYSIDIDDKNSQLSGRLNTMEKVRVNANDDMKTDQQKVVSENIHVNSLDEDNEIQLKQTFKWLQGLRGTHQGRSLTPYKRLTLDRLRTMTSLDLSYLDVTDADLKYLKCLPFLTELDMQSTDITNDSIKIIASWKSLTSLNLCSVPVTIDGFALLKTLPLLNELHLNYDHVSFENMKMLSDFPSLRTLHLQFVRITAAAMEGLATSSTLTHLNLWQAKVDADAFKFLAMCPALKKIDLNYAKFSKGIGFLASSNSLVELHLDGTNIDDEDLKALSQSFSLSMLYANRTKITDKGVEALTMLQTLTHLQLSSTAVTDKSLDYIFSLPNITNLDLSDTKITNEGYRKLVALPFLTYLNLSETEITNEDLRVILSSLTSLTEIDLFKSNNITEESIKYLKERTTLKKIRLPASLSGKCQSLHEALPECDITYQFLSPTLSKGLADYFTEDGNQR